MLFSVRFSFACRTFRPCESLHSRFPVSVLPGLRDRYFPASGFFCTQKAPGEPRICGAPGAFAKAGSYCRIDGSQVAISGTKQRRTISRAIMKPKGADP